MSTPKRSLVLAGGGVRLAYQAGVLQALEEEGLSFSHVDGTSGGIFNAAMMASGLSPEEMSHRWRNLNLVHFMAPNRFWNYFRPSRITGMAGLGGIRKKVFPALGIDPEKIRSGTGIAATFNVCNFSDKTVESIPRQQVTEDHLAAGVSLPMAMPAVRIGADWYTDAVWIKDANLMEAVKQGAEEIWLVWAIGNNREYLPGLFNQYVHMIEMSANGGLLLEFEQLAAVNERISEGRSPYGQTHPIVLHVIRPALPLPLDPDLFFDRIDTATLINKGYADTKAYLRNRQPDGIIPGIRSTAMKEPDITLSFRQHYGGSLKLSKKPVHVCYSTAFHFCNGEKGKCLELFSDITIGPFGRPIPTFANEATFGRSGRQTVIRTTSLFMHAQQMYRIRAVIKLGVVADWLLGLEFKTVKLTIYRILDDGTESTFLQGRLSQPIRQRLRNCFSSNVRHHHGRAWKIIKKFTLIKQLYRHEI